MTGTFIVIDGPSGAGKSTHAALLRDRLAAAGHNVIATAQPSDERLGRLARYQTDRYQGLPLACLVAADRYFHLAHVIEPALDAGKVVVCDRYVASSYVLQHLDGVDPGFLRTLNQHTVIPDLMIMLTGNPQQSQQRAQRRGVYSRFHHINSWLEATLYQAVAHELAHADYPVMNYDVDELTIERINDDLCDAAVSTIAHTASCEVTAHQ